MTTTSLSPWQVAELRRELLAEVPEIVERELDRRRAEDHLARIRRQSNWLFGVYLAFCGVIFVAGITTAIVSSILE